jgi:hypothetical protein
MRLTYDDLLDAAYRLGVPPMTPTRADAITFARQQNPRATLAEASAAYDEWYLQDQGRPWHATEADIERVAVPVRQLLLRESLLPAASLGRVIRAFHGFLGQQTGVTFDACWAAIVAAQQALGAP